MKKLYMALTALFALAIICVISPKDVFAAEKNIDIETDKVITKDLDNDGTAEKILMTEKYSDDEFFCTFTITINDEVIKVIERDIANDWDSRWEAALVDMTDYDGNWMIFLEDTLYRYKDGKITPLKNKTGLSLYNITGYSKKGYCYAYTDSSSFKLSFMCDTWEQVKFKVYLKKDTFKLKGKFTVSLDTSYWEGLLKDNITLYSKRSAKAANKVATVKEGSQVYVSKAYVNPSYKIKVDGKSYKFVSATWIYVKDTAGNKGWFNPQLDYKEIFEGDTLPSFEFKTLFSNGKYAG